MIGSNWTVPVKLYLLIGLSALSALVIALVAISASRDLAALGHEVFEVGLDRSLQASQIALEFEKQAGVLNLVTYQLDIAASETKKAEFAARSAEIKDLLAKLFAVVTGDDAEYGRQISPALADLDRDAQQLFSLVAELQTNEAADLLSSKLTPRIAQINAMLLEFKERMFAAADAGVTNMDRRARDVSVLLFVIFLGLLVASLVVGGYIARTISRPLAALTSTIQAVAAGQLDITVHGVDRRDEVGSLARATEVFLENARNTKALVTSVAQTASQVAQSVEQASSAVGHVADGASAQLETVRDVSQALNMSSSAIASVSESTQAAGQNVRTVRNRTIEGMERMRAMVRDVEEIAVSTKRIASITQSIARIATQTNMLSLNAAIEAARAGDHGRGFAVVAEEVRKLAESSGQMAREIAELIRTATEQAANGVEKAQLVNTEIEGISNEIAQSDQLVNSIAVSMEQQRTTMEALDQRMKELMRIGQSNASASEEISATMLDLAKLAERSKAQAQEFGR